jgi:hypothetical protein
MKVAVNDNQRNFYAKGHDKEVGMISKLGFDLDIVDSNLHKCTL